MRCSLSPIYEQLNAEAKMDGPVLGVYSLIAYHLIGETVCGLCVRGEREEKCTDGHVM